MSFSGKHKKKYKEAAQRTLRFFVEFCFVLIVVGLVFCGVNFFNRYQKMVLEKEVEPGKSYRESGDFYTMVLGEETEGSQTQDEEKNEPVLRSENYKTRLVTFGGNAALPLDDNQKLEIAEIQSELLTTRNQEEVKLVVSWKTNKPAISEIIYGKNIEQDGISIEDDKFGYAHSAVLSSLDASSAYTYLIKSRDKWGEEIYSDRFAFYTGAPNVSLLDLLLGAFKDVFGWAMKK